MGRPRRSSIIGNGEVTPRQVAFLVDRYLCDNRFLRTRTLFRSEASSLISKSPLCGVPSGLMTLDGILNSYVDLKQQMRTLEEERVGLDQEKVRLDQERVRLDQEKLRVQNLLQGVQNVIRTYNASFIPAPAPALTPTPAPAPAPTYQQNNYNVP